jgi:hypothetical protein
VARALYARGMSFRGIGRRLGIPHHTVRYWCLVTKTPDSWYANDRPCPRCQDPPGPPADVTQYNYLLGQYLGDGHLATAVKTPVLRIACANTYPQIMDECEAAMRAVLARSVHRVSAPGCTVVQSYSNHWPCLLPQAGPGMKHTRPIELADWQRRLVTMHPGAFVRGLFHSDGSRFDNRVMVAGKTYSYPRYMFSNESRDILALCGEALDLLGVAWRLNRRNCLSVARRTSVALLDLHIGPKR